MLPEILGCYQSSKREKMGRAGTGRNFTQSIAWLALRLPPESILIFPLGRDKLPLPLQKSISAEEFLAHFLPEPLLYQEQLAPAAQVLAQLLRNTGDTPIDQTVLSGAERALYTVLLAALGSTGHQDPPAAVLPVLEAAVASRAAVDDVQKASINAFGIHLRKRRDFDTAIIFYRKALEMAPDDIRLLFNLARALYEKGAVSECRAALEQALARSPDFMEARKFLHYLDRQAAEPSQDDVFPDITL